MAKKVVKKAETTAQKTERLMQAMFNAKAMAKEAEAELLEYVEENEAEMFAKSNTYTVRYGQINKTNTTALEFEKKVTYTAEAVVGLYEDAEFIKFLKLELGKTAFENLIDKAKIADVLIGGDKKLIKMFKNMGIIGVQNKQTISFKQIEFAE